MKRTKVRLVRVVTGSNRATVTTVKQAKGIISTYLWGYVRCQRKFYCERIINGIEFHDAKGRLLAFYEVMA